MSFKIIDIEQWLRKEHFQFFSGFDNPFWGIVVGVECTKAYETAKKNNHSFFASYLHKSIVAVNQIPELKIRQVGQNIVAYDTIHASSTIARNDGTFGFSYIPFNKDFTIFNENLQNEIDRVQKTTGLAMLSEEEKQNVIHYSSTPWLNFTSLSHAKNLKFVDSIPKITFGKATFEENKMKMPVAFNAHHGFVDGLHAGKFFEAFQKLLNED